MKRLKEKWNSVKKFQQFYTPDDVIKQMLGMGYNVYNNEDNFIALEPTAGTGNIVKYLTIKDKTLSKMIKKYYMVEYDEKNRKLLQSIAEDDSGLLQLELWQTCHIRVVASAFPDSCTTLPDALEHAWTLVD